MQMPLENAIGVSAAQQRLLYSLTPLKFDDANVYCVVPSIDKAGFDLFLYDDDGLKFRRTELSIIDNFVTKCGGYSVLKNNAVNFEYAYAAHYKNVNIFLDKLLSFIKISKPIEQNSKLESWLKKNGNAFDKGMICM